MHSATLSQLSWKLAMLAGALLTLCSYCSASTIVSVTDSLIPVNRGFFFLGGEFSNVVTVSWTQATSFSHVAIDASLVSVDSDFKTGTAYLMTAIGPGTTPASEVVTPVGFTAPTEPSDDGSAPLTVLFSGLTLGPGTYYLVLSAPSGTVGTYYGSPLGWQIATDPVITTAASVTLGSTATALESEVNPFPPASSFGPSGDRPIFGVASVPEPRTSVLFLISLAALILYKRSWMVRRAFLAALKTRS